MRKLISVLVLAIFFVSVVFGSVRIKPKNEVLPKYSKEETAAANLWLKSKSLNNLENENIIFPNQTIFFAFPSVTDWTASNVEPGDYVLKMAKRLLREKNFTVSNSRVELTSQGGTGFLPSPVNTDSFPRNNSGLYVLLVCLFLCICLFLYLLYKMGKRATEREKSHDEDCKYLRGRIYDLQMELVKTKNKLPVEVPDSGKVTNEWLKEDGHCPIGRSIEGEDSLTFLTNHSAMGEVGKLPDLVVKAIATTKSEAVKMGFSHNREAITGLDKVTVFIGWNWNKEKGRWEEVGMIAGSCQNQFQMNPEKVKKIGGLFLSLELADDRHPVVHENQKVVKGQHYPSLIKGLVVKFYKKTIADLKRAGMEVKTSEEI